MAVYVNLWYWKSGGYGENVTCNLMEGRYTIGESVTITVKAKAGCTIDGTPFLYYTANNGQNVKDEFKKVSDKEYTLTTSFNNVQYSGTNTRVYLYMRGIAASTFVLEQLLENCSSDRTDGEFPLNENFVITIRANTGYEFQEPPTYQYSIDYQYYDGKFIKVSEFEYQKTFNFSSYTKLSVSANAVKQSIVTDKYGILTVYNPDKEILKTMASKWFVASSTNADNTTAISYISTSDYIVSLIKLFCHVVSDDWQELKLGPYSMGIDCPVIGTDTIMLDCGTIHITGKYQNAIDYENTEIEIYLPFVGFVSLKTSDFMDKDVNLYYQVNVINGDSLAVLKADGNIIYTATCNVAFQVPYRTNANKDINRNINPNNNYLLDTAPFIYVKTHISAMPENRPYNDTNVYAKFGYLSGYIEADEIDMKILSQHITKPEIDEIRQLLESGVFL